jgi:hypothetical protein
MNIPRPKSLKSCKITLNMYNNPFVISITARMKIFAIFSRKSRRQLKWSKATHKFSTRLKIRWYYSPSKKNLFHIYVEIEQD